MKKIALIVCFFGTFPFIVFSQNLDIRILRSIHLNRSESMDPAFRFVSNSVLPLSIATPLSVIVAGKISGNRVMFRDGLTIGASMLLNETMTEVVKYSVNRKRPYEKYPDIKPQMSVRDPSFPSGHTSNAFCTATALSLACPKWYVVVPSYSWAALVGYSRLDLGMHYPSDVVAGAIIGAGSAFLCFKLRKVLEKRYETKHPVIPTAMDGIYE